MLLNLPKEITIYCCQYLLPVDVYKLRNFLSPLHTIKSFYDRITYIKCSFPSSIIKVMGGFQKFLSFPALEWKNEFIGFTDYIDRISPCDVSDPIMIGIDCYRRSFITLKLYKDNQQEFVITLFQRYTNDPNTWTHGKRGYLTIIHDSGYFMNSGKWNNDEFKDILHDLCDNKKVVVRQQNIEQSYTLVN